MKIRGIEGMSNEQVEQELQRGARFVVFQYCISILVMSFKRSSDIYFVKAGEGTGKQKAGFSALSLLLGWWGIPWGPIWTIATVFRNASGGVDVTADILAQSRQQQALRQPMPRAPGAV